MSSIRKRATMMIDSDEEEDEDLLNALPQPKRKRNDHVMSGPAVEVQDIANGPKDFIKTLTDAGFYPRSGNQPNLLSVHQTDFQQSLRDALTSDVQFPRNIGFFVSECNEFFDDRETFIKALQPTENATVDSTTAMVLPQDSLVRLLLNVDEVQPRLIQAVLQRFAKAAKDDQPTGPNQVDLPMLILSQMAWLNHIAEPVQVADSLLDLIHSSSVDIKKDIISQLPALVADKEQIRVAFALIDMLESDLNLTAAVLDALGDLNLPPDDSADLRAKVVKKLPAVPLETVPVLLTFVFKRIGPNEAAGLIEDVRLHLDKALKKRQDRTMSKDSINDCICLAAESVQNSIIRFRPLADVWFKGAQVLFRNHGSAVRSAIASDFDPPLPSAHRTLLDVLVCLAEIQNQSDHRNHYCLDLLVLIMQHKLPGRHRNVELLLKKKLKTEVFSDRLIRDTFQLYACVLGKHFFEPLRAIADSLLLTKDPLVVPNGSLFYQEMFTNFEEYYQQEVVESLIQHICCGGGEASSSDSPAAWALTVLSDLAETRWEHLVRFASFILALLEYLTYMALPQVKRVMELFAKLAYGFAADDPEKTRLASFSASIQSELLMIVKKQLANTSVEFQRMGVLGAVALVEVLGNPDLIPGEVDLTSLSAGATALLGYSNQNGVLSNEQRLQLAKSVIDMVTSGTKRAPEVAALWLDEMASLTLLREIHPSLHSYLYDSISETFQESFVVDEDEQPLNVFKMPLSLQYCLDANEEDESNVKLVFLNIAPMVLNEHNRKAGERATKPTLTTLVSHFRLLRNTIECYEHASLEDIDALLGCALCLPTDEILDEFDTLEQSEKDAVCRCFIHSVNWFIEVINTFARSKNKNMRAKVVQRLRDIADLKEKFFRCLAKNTTFLPPPSVFSGEPIRSRVSTAAANPKSGKVPNAKKPTKAGSKVAKSKKQLGVTTLQTPNKSVFHSTPNTSLAERLDFTASQQGTTEAKDGSIVQSTYVIHFREIDFGAFTLLSSPLDMSPGASPTSNSLKPKDLEMLLVDFTVKIEHKLLKSAQRFPLQPNSSSDRESFVMLDLYSPMNIAQRAVTLVKRLCGHLESVSGYFQQLIEMNDGILDGPEMFTEMGLRLGHCYQLLFRCLNRIFSWHGFQKESAGALREDALKFMASRTLEEWKTASTEEIKQTCFTYTEKFSNSLPSFACAVEQINLLSTLHHWLDDADLAFSKRLVSVAEKHLARGWANKDGQEKGPSYNRGVECLLQVYLLQGGHEEVLDKVGKLVNIAMSEVLDSDEVDGESEAFRTCNKSTYAVYFRSAFIALLDAEKKIPSPSAKHQLSPEAVKASLKSWATTVKLLHTLVGRIKSKDKKTILITCLKYGRAIVEQFHKSAMPLLDKQFKHFHVECQELVKNLQMSTRRMMHACNHAKKSADASLAVYVPAMMKTHQQLMLRVKVMLAANGCAGAFWTGNLRNKDLEGKEIPSQDISDVSADEAESENDEASEVEATEDDDNVTVALSTIEDEDSRSREY